MLAMTGVLNPVMVTIFDAYTLFILASVIEVNENESGVVSMVPL